jgi:hypothetical protein
MNEIINKEEKAMKELNKKEAENMKDKDIVKNEEMEMEIPIPEEVSLKYTEWFENPFPIKVFQIEKVIKTGSWLVLGTDESENGKIYKIYFPSYYPFHKIQIDNENENEVVIMYIDEETGKIKFKVKDDLPF